jgi:glyoxylase I family protein
MNFHVLRIDHIVLRVASLERAIAFYRDVLGCHVIKRRDDLGFVHVRVGSSMIDLVAVDGPTGRRGGAAAGAEGRNLDHFCLRVEPFDEAAIVARLAGHGIEPTAIAPANFGAEGTGPSIYFSDPDGNTIELKGPADASVG